MSRRAVVYLRVSTEEQADSGLSILAQEDACRAAAARSGLELAGPIHRDEGLSGAKPLEKRPALIAAIGQLGRGDCLLIAKRDRIFRTDPFDGAVIQRAVDSKGARILSAAGEGTQDDSPSSILMAAILDAFARYERLIGIGRTRAALAAKRAKGERCGQVPYGLRVGPDGRTLEPDGGDGLALAALDELAAAGLSTRRIAAELDRRGFPTKNGGAWSASTVRRLLSARKGGPCPEKP
jgi:DNA invertase Pin-like site-specific DNA recombinase